MVLILLLLTAGLIGAGASYAFSDQPATADTKAALDAHPSEPEGVELPAERTATSDTFRLPSGERETRVYGSPINFQDEEGSWQPIGEGLEETASGKITNGANSFDIHLPQSLDQSPVRLTTGDSWVAERPLSINTAPAELEGEAASYERQGSGVGLEFSGLANGLKEKIELAGPNSPSTLHFELEASTGLTASVGPEGAIQFRDEANHLVAELPPPAMYDSAAVPNVSNAVHYAIESDGQGKWKLTVEADREWLSAPDRSWPVTIDPSVTIPTTTQDCSIFNGPYSEYNLCGSGGWQTNGINALYKSSGEDEYGRLLLQFDLSSIPATASITSATLGVYSPSKAANTLGVELGGVTKPWTTSVNWHRYALGAAWQYEGGDYSLPGSHNIGIYTASRGSEPGWWNFTGQPVAWLVQRWLSGSLPNDGVLLKLMDERSHQCSPSCIERRIEFSTNGAANKPYLSVNYIPPAPKGSQVTSPTEGTRSAKRYKLQAAWTHEGVSGVTFQYQAPEGWENVPEAKVTNAKGEAIKWPLPVKASDRTSEPVYWNAPEKSIPVAILKGHIRAVLSGTAAAEGYTQPVEAQLNRDLGGPKDALTQIGPGTVDLLTGNLAISQTDVSIPLFNSSLEFSRSFNSRAAKAEEKGVLGPGWVPGSPVEEAGESAWKSIREAEETETYLEYVEYENEEEEIEEEAIPQTITYKYALLTTLGGEEVAFNRTSSGYEIPPEMTGWSLTEEGPSKLVLAEPGGSRTTFEDHEGGSEYVPVAISQPGGEGNKSELEYEFPEKGKKRLKMVVAPSPPGRTCTTSNAKTEEGCHALTFTYSSTANGDRLTGISYYAPGNGGHWEVARYVYNSEGRLSEEYDPRIYPKLAQTYTYQSGGQIKTITPPGQEPWTMEYGITKEDEINDGRLIAVTRPSLLSSPASAKTTIAYEVPLSGAGAPYNMSLAAVSEWGQTDVPLDATAVFPPSEVPASPPSSYGQATVYYMDAEGHLINTATPSGAGTSSPSIATSESNEYGDIVRELSPKNRLAVLAKPEAERKATWEALETKRRYTEEGTQMVEEWGPMHQVRIAETGEVAEARLHTVVEYDQGWPGTGVKPHLPTRETTGASNPKWGSDKEQQVTETKYNWNLRKPTETIVDPGTGHLNIKSVTVYDETTGLPVESRQPKSAGESSSPGTTKTIYYAPGAPAPCSSSAYAGLPCEVRPGAQASGTGRPELLVRRFGSYNSLAEPTEVLESPNGEVGNVRRTTTGYDLAGRQLTRKVEGGGTQLPIIETLYSPTLGLPEKQQFKCTGAECAVGGASYQSSFGAAGNGNGKFAHPAGIAITSSDALWVVDENNKRIEKFNEAGEYQSSFGSSGTGNGQFSRPTDIAIDAKGNLWVTDAGNSRIEEFNENGEYLAKFGSSGIGNGQFEEPESIAIANGHVWVADTHDRRLQEFNESREFIKAVGPGGTGHSTEGELKEPTGIAIGPENTVWVADWANDRVEEFTEAGEFVRQFGHEGAGNGSFNRPDVIEVDNSGNVLVGDQNNERVQEFTQAGVYVGKFGSAGSGAGQFSFGWPMGIASSGNKVWVSDTSNNRVEKWTYTGFDSQATRVAHDTLGRATEYEDADGNVAKVTYDVDGRPVTTTDNKGSQTITYDPTSGLPTKLEDSAAGTFTATYDADGNLKSRTLPDGLTATTTYNAADEPIGLGYTKETNCGTSCTWLEENLERSISGQILTNNGTLVNDSYFYDKDGRLVEARETAPGGFCTTRAYAYDADSNRLSWALREPGIGGACVTSGGSELKYSYDKADRLEGPTYDALGRITSLPAEFAGGRALGTTYYSTNMVATQTQGTITNSYELDAEGRQRARLQGGGGLEGIEVFHYDGPSDSVAWSERGSTWARSIGGLGGELAAIQESGSGVTLQLTDLHGDVIATAEPSPTATKLKATFRFDEFGNPISGSAGRFGWLGGKQRRTETSWGVIQMGARSYVPDLGRFLTPDPAPGGSANPYDYAGQDPVNGMDLNGEKFCIHEYGQEICGRNARQISRGATRARRQTRRLSRESHVHTPVVKTRVCTALACRIGWPGTATNPATTSQGFSSIVSAANTVVHLLVKYGTGSAMNWAEGTGDDRITGCAKDASEAWAETSELRGAAAGDGLPVELGAAATSALYAAASCVGYAAGG